MKKAERIAALEERVKALEDRVAHLIVEIEFLKLERPPYVPYVPPYPSPTNPPPTYPPTGPWWYQVWCNSGYTSKDKTALAARSDA